MLPILISVSVTPGSYFFWASALLPLAASKRRAVENAANRRGTKDISFFSLMESMKVSVGDLFRVSCPILNTLRQTLSISMSATARALSTQS